jgi:PBSX family phage terminase large subunit
VTSAIERLAKLPPTVLAEIRAELGPSFVNAQQEAFFDSEAPEVLYSGAFRAGKSRIGCEKAYSLAKRYPGIPIGIFRKTAASLAASTERTLLHDVIPRGEIVRSNRTERWYELANGSRIWLFGLDPDPITGLPSKVGSVELGWAFVDEAAECSEADWIMVKGRLSWPGITWHQITAATNPASPKHWLKQRFTPSTPEREYLHASTFDNPALPQDYLDEARAGVTDYFKRRYILGEWVGAEGQIWQLPDEQIVDVPGPWKQVVAGVDWGFVHAFACEVVGQSGSGRLSVIDEVYERGVTIDKIIPALQFVRETHGIKRFFADPSEPAYIAQCRAAGLPMEPARNDVSPGIAAVSKAIAQGMTVSPHCKGLLGEIPGYTWATTRAGGFAEKPIEINDDACDGLRYACASLDPSMSDNPWAQLAGQRAGAVA